ncbi:MAG: CBS domain-containing protein [Actinomycetota bacterium]
MQKIRDLMTSSPIMLEARTSLSEAARRMREEDIGDVLVLRDGVFRGIVTDRDIAIRCVAEGRDPDQTSLGDICTQDVVTIEPDADTTKAKRLMAESAVRRLPVVEGKRPIGIISLGDLAIQNDPASVLADISSAPANT